MPKKIMIIAPFWGHAPHLGNIRVDRFVRWLSDKEMPIILVRAGLADEERETSWGLEITIRDPLGKWGKPETGGAQNPVGRPPSRFRTSITNLLFNPDMTVMWARRLVQHPLVVKHGQEVDWVIASSPPESGQLAAYWLARKFSVPLIVDMRDGWLDEPLKPALLQSRFHRWREGRLERNILRYATRIFVVSSGLKKMMAERLPFTEEKITLLTNGYPQEVTAEMGEKTRASDTPRLNLLYAGRFTGSRNSHKAHFLIEPLLAGIRAQDRQGTINLLGDFTAEELQDIAAWQTQFEAAGWTLEVQPRVSRAEAMSRMAQADGLLFITGTSVVLSAKLFEYLATGRPILAAAPENGAVWNACMDLPQVFLMPLSAPETAKESARQFLNAAAQPTWPYQIPAAFSEGHLSKVFLEAVGVSEIR